MCDGGMTKELIRGVCVVGGRGGGRQGSNTCVCGGEDQVIFVCMGGGSDQGINTCMCEGAHPTHMYILIPCFPLLHTHTYTKLL